MTIFDSHFGSHIPQLDNPVFLLYNTRDRQHGRSPFNMVKLRARTPHLPPPSVGTRETTNSLRMQVANCRRASLQASLV